MRGIIKIAFTYVGAVIGAGFVSGQEILNFFVIYGSKGLILTLITGLLFAVLGNIIFLISEKLAVASYSHLFLCCGGKKLGLAADLMLTLFLLSSFIIMLVGSKEIFNHLFDLRYNLGLTLTLIIVIITNLYGLEGVLNLNSILIPTLLLIIISFSLGLDFKIDDLQFAFSLKQLSSAVTYTGYNLVLAMAVLLPLLNKFSKLEVVWGIISGGLILGVVAFLIAYILIGFQGYIIGEQLPMLKAVSIFKPQFYYLYALTLWLAMLTTASCNLYALLDRFKLVFNYSREKMLIMLIVIIIPTLQFSFADLVEVIYPKLGIISLLLFASLLLTYGIQTLYFKVTNV
ncbi:MAG: YkvI family membrane protein [Bacillota bacterium]